MATAVVLDDYQPVSLAARSPGVSEATVREWCDRGILRTIRDPRGWRLVLSADVARRRLARERARSAKRRSRGCAGADAGPAEQLAARAEDGR